MATARTVKKTGKKTPVRRGGHSTQARKPIGRKKPLGGGRKTSNKTPRARKLGKQSGAASKEPVEVLETSKTSRKRRS
jgi:hypothetical protein